VSAQLLQRREFSRAVRPARSGDAGPALQKKIDAEFKMYYHGGIRKHKRFNAFPMCSNDF
jgi:hypothetical protein